MKKILLYNIECGVNEVCGCAVQNGTSSIFVLRRLLLVFLTQWYEVLRHANFLFFYFISYFYF